MNVKENFESLRSVWGVLLLTWDYKDRIPGPMELGKSHDLF